MIYLSKSVSHFNSGLCARYWWTLSGCKGVVHPWDTNMLLLTKSLENGEEIYPSPVTGNICHLSYMDSIAQDQHAHLHSMPWELHCPLISQWTPTLKISRQCTSQVRLCRYARWPWATQSAYGILLGSLKLYTQLCLSFSSLFFCS